MTVTWCFLDECQHPSKHAAPETEAECGSRLGSKQINGLNEWCPLRVALCSQGLLGHLLTFAAKNLGLHDVLSMQKLTGSSAPCAEQLHTQDKLVLNMWRNALPM